MLQTHAVEGFWYTQDCSSQPIQPTSTEHVACQSQQPITHRPAGCLKISPVDIQFTYTVRSKWKVRAKESGIFLLTPQTRTANLFKNRTKIFSTSPQGIQFVYCIRTLHNFCMHCYQTALSFSLSHHMDFYRPANHWNTMLLSTIHSSSHGTMTFITAFFEERDIYIYMHSCMYVPGRMDFYWYIRTR